MECKKEINKANCKCSYPCSNRGMCCECVKSHRENNEIPGCFFPKEAEKLMTGRYRISSAVCQNNFWRLFWQQKK